MIYTDFDAIPRRAYQVIEADPPWHHKTRSPKGQKRGPSRHYKTMSIEQIKALPVGDIAAKDCWLILWTTQPHLPLALDVMAAWGFKYSSVYKFWIKLNKRASNLLFLDRDVFKGMGYTTRKNIELVLIGRRGNPKRLRKDISDTLISPRREHSRKPDEFYSELATFAAGPRIALFTRDEKTGFDVFGDEVGKFSGDNL